MDYIRPGGMDEVLDLLAKGEAGTYKIYAGGTDVIPKVKKRVIDSPQVLLDLKGIMGLDYIDYNEKDGLRIGALASVRSVAESGIVKEKYPVLSRAAGSIASVQIRNRATIAGNICNAVPSADSAPALLTLNAELKCISRKGERTINVNEFFKGPGLTALEPDEIVKEIRVPIPDQDTRGIYIKLSPRSSMDLAVVGVALMGLVEDGLFKDVRIGLGAVAPTPERALKAEELLNGAKADEGMIDKASEIAASEARPIDDHRGSAEYRREMVGVLVRRGLKNIVMSK